MSDDICSICLCDPTYYICTTPCNHTFHIKCLIKALEKKTTCPICRHILLDEVLETFKTSENESRQTTPRNTSQTAQQTTPRNTSRNMRTRSQIPVRYRFRVRNQQSNIPRTNFVRDETRARHDDASRLSNNNRASSISTPNSTVPNNSSTSTSSQTQSLSDDTQSSPLNSPRSEPRYQRIVFVSPLKVFRKIFNIML